MQYTQQISFVLLLCFGLQFSGVGARSETQLPGFLTYYKYQSNHNLQYGQISAAGRSILEVEADSCSALSPSGKLVAIIAPESNSLRIVRLADQTVLLEQVWVPTSEGCNWGWFDEEHLTISTSQRFSVNTGEVIEVHPIILQRNSLPNSVLGEPAVATLDGNYVVYNQCLADNFDFGDGFCPGASQVVIYDTKLQRVLTVLVDANAGILGEREEDMGWGPVDVPSVFWSPSGRYLLYMASTGGLRIYDKQDNKFTNIPLPPHVILSVDWLGAGVQWSTSENQIGFWVFDQAGEKSPDALQRFAVFNLFSHETELLTRQYRMQDWLWSPDEEAIALTTQENDLLVVNLATQAATTLDRGVYALAAWSK